jgi:hypothetical protein
MVISAKALSVVGIAGGADRGADAVKLQGLGEADGSLLRPGIEVANRLVL